MDKKTRIKAGEIIESFLPEEEPKPKEQRIKTLFVKNIARVTEAHIEPPDYGLVEICGKNGAGKTTILRSIFAAFGGKVPEVTNGESLGKVYVDTDDLHIELYVTPKNDKIHVKEKRTGAKIRSPKTVLKSFFGKRAFNVFDFLSAKPKEQIDILLNVVNIPFSADEFSKMLENRISINDKDSVTEIINEAYKQIMEERRIVNRKVKTLSSLISSYGELSIQNEVNLSPLYELKEEIKAIQQKKEKIALAKRDIVSMKAREQEIYGRIEDLKKQAEDLNERIKRAETDVAIDESDVKEGAPYTLEEIETEIKKAFKNNEDYKKNIDKIKRQDELLNFEAESKKLTSLLEAIQEYKVKLMQQTDFPVAGLDIQRGQIYFNNSPLNDASGAEQLRVAIAIAYAEMPKTGLQALFIFDPPQIDAENMKIISDFANEKKIQLWIAKVQDHKDSGTIYITEGKIIKNENES